jgi:hypothetical protein
MGQITTFDIGSIIARYGVETYVETGTGEGISLSYAMQFPFKGLHSIDIDPELVEDVKTRLGGPSVYIHCDYSKNALPVILAEIPPTPTLFFLDAHFPGADFHKTTYEESIETYKQDAFPLEQEIDIIVSGRDTSGDVFIIDDLILYEPDAAYDHVAWNGPYKYGKLQEQVGASTDLGFLYSRLENTHNFQKYTKDQGYLVAIPKDR